MADFNIILDAGDVENNIVNVVVEIPKWSTLKIEWNRELAVFELDRVEPSIFPKPVNYGFIPQTLDEDGDELDALVLTNEPIPTGVFLKGRVVGVLKFVDDGEVDDKIIVVPEDDRNTGNQVMTMDEIHVQWKQKIEHHFNHYKDLKKPGSTKVEGWGDTEEAKKVIRESITRWQNK